MLVPIRAIRDRWPAPLQCCIPDRFSWPDPAVLLAASVGADEFRTAMNALNVGGTIKITGTDRHRAADKLLLDNVDLTTATIVDIGASDGSTSLDLIAKLPAFE